MPTCHSWWNGLFNTSSLYPVYDRIGLLIQSLPSPSILYKVSCIPRVLTCRHHLLPGQLGSTSALSTLNSQPYNRPDQALRTWSQYHLSPCLIMIPVKIHNRKHVTCGCKSFFVEAWNLYAKCIQDLAHECGEWEGAWCHETSNVMIPNSWTDKGSFASPP